MSELDTRSEQNLKETYSLSHGRGGDRSDNVGMDVVLGSLSGERLGECDETHLSGRVVGLTHVAVETGSLRKERSGRVS
jgi:hypothetical protein